tara:strand:+ start:81763 stop:82341 length:579 start_codon:yes stop_codon:yes gene_type:complete
MKTIIRKSVFVALMLGTFSSYATGTTLVSKVKTEGKVELINVKKGQRWSIKNSEGKTLYQEEIKSSGSYTQEYAFTSLKNGYYTMEVNKDFQIQITPFTIVSGKVTFYKKEEKVIFKPVLRTQEHTVMISKLDFEASPLKIIIYYEGDVIFKDTLEGEDILNRVYKLKKDIKGSYKVVMKANDRTYINEFSL